MLGSASDSVLVVQSEPGIRGLLSRWLEQKGFRVAGAGTSAEALASMSVAPARVAVCDVASDEHDRLWLARELRSRYPQTAVVIATGVRDPVLACTSLESGAVDCLLKPFTAEQFLDAVERARWSCPPTSSPIEPGAAEEDEGRACDGTSVSPERRAAARLAPRKDMPVVARLRSGRALMVLNFSSDGLLGESGFRLLPGIRTDVSVSAEGGVTSLRAMVLRCEVSYVDASRVRYRAAMHFDSRVHWPPVPPSCIR
jgi:CheY-like chemotaxis protein